MKLNPNQWIIFASSVSAILVSCAWIYSSQTRSKNYNVGLHRYVGRVMAEQAATLAGTQGKIVLLSIDDKKWPELRTQIDQFKSILKQRGRYEFREHTLDTKEQAKYGVGTGLSGRRYARTVRKNADAALFVSFVGAPNLTAEEAAEVGNGHKLLAESRSGDNLPQLFERHLISAAVVSRFQFPAPGPENPRTPEEWFAKRYQLLTPATVPSSSNPDLEELADGQARPLVQAQKEK